MRASLRFIILASALLFDCASLILGGVSDWRLPRVKELHTLLDFGARAGGPLLDSAAFPEEDGSYYWSGTPSSWHVDRFWTVSFTFGRTYAAKPEDPYTVRCVR